MRQLQKTTSVEKQLNEIIELKERLAVLEGELKTYMDMHDIDHVIGTNHEYVRTWVNEYLKLNTQQLKTEYPEIYSACKNQVVAGNYRYQLKKL